MTLDDKMYVYVVRHYGEIQGIFLFEDDAINHAELLKQYDDMKEFKTIIDIDEFEVK